MKSFVQDVTGAQIGPITLKQKLLIKFNQANGN